MTDDYDDKYDFLKASDAIFDELQRGGKNPNLKYLSNIRGDIRFTASNSFSRLEIHPSIQLQFKHVCGFFNKN